MRGRTLRSLRLFVGVAVFGGALVVLTQGCQDATQATLSITLDPRAKCSEIPRGTAITVGVDPADVEARVASHFVTAKTQDCTDGRSPQLAAGR